MPFDPRLAMPDASRVFYRHRTLRDIQNLVAQPLLTGQSVLLSAPTASGKTEAVFAPLYQRHVSFGRSALSVVYVAPTKALVNDMYERLGAYFGEATSECVQRYTGDHHEFADDEGKFALVATPEALDSLQLTKRYLLRNVRAVICDEVHALHGTARGQQLRAVWSRIRACASRPRDARDRFQAVGMTATLRDAEAVAHCWLGEGAAVVTAPGRREIDIAMVPTDGRPVAALANQIRALRPGKVLVFANSRNGAHHLAYGLSSALAGDGWPVFLHIGILGVTERERVEQAMKAEPRGVCVATSTLEVGIDIGDIDVVALVDPPTTVSAFLQRIGRGNRRSGACTVWACYESVAQARVIEALHYCATAGELDDVHEYDRPSVHFQQVLSLAWAGLRQGSVVTRENLPRRAGASVDQAVVDDMIQSGVLVPSGNGLIPSDEWCDAGDERRIHSVIAGGANRPMVDIHTGEVIGAGLGQAETGGVLFTGGQLRQVRAADESGTFLAGTARSQRERLVTLPAVRGGVRGLSRQVVRAMALTAGLDPDSWDREGGLLLTYGGGPYNHLLHAVLRASGYAVACKADSFGISGLGEKLNLTPNAALKLAEDVLSNRSSMVKSLERFREPTQFLNALSPRLRREEAMRAAPVRGFLEWLAGCS